MSWQWVYFLMASLYFIAIVTLSRVPAGTPASIHDVLEIDRQARMAAEQITSDFEVTVHS